ncbi:MAG: hypothetical protein LBJ12_02365 [Oscillospiraceae bacterium]|jgi:hypothetical protein|nr:hypothetical protein [Oscillospiraceae bacterium]
MSKAWGQTAPINTQDFTAYLSSIGAQDIQTPNLVYAAATESGTNVKLPTVANLKYKADTLDGENSVRTKSGVMHRSILRQGVMTLAIGWNSLTWKETVGLCSLLKPGAKNDGANDFVWVCFPSAIHNGYIKIKCYCTTPEVNANYWCGKDSAGVRHSMDVNLIEY